MTSLKWGILGSGNIAHAFAGGLEQTDSGSAYAIASRDERKAREFAERYAIAKPYGNYQALLDDPLVDALYIATPHPQHAEWAIKGADAGKQILCEKPVCVNHADAMLVIEAARRNRVFFMEAFMFRCHPQIQKLLDLIGQGIIGEIRLIEASFGFNAGDNFTGRTLNQSLAGGGILDVGCYPLAFARLIAGAVSAKPFLDPSQIKATGHVGKQSQVDEWATASLQFENGIVAQISTAVRVKLENTARIYGEKGSITLLSPWMANGRAAGDVVIQIHLAGAEVQQLSIHLDRSTYALEADIVAANIEKGQAPYPCMNWLDTLGNMQALDEWRRQIGLVYPAESVQAYRQTLQRTPLQVTADTGMPYGKISGISKKISRLVMGTDNQTTIGHATAMFDDFFSRGGNCFDSAHIYGGGRLETLFGQWQRNRNIRDEVVLIGKGAHSPRCFPDALKEQLVISLDRLQTDYVDIYFMHRDNLDVPVGEFVDVLNELREKGQIGIFGGSNWSIERLQQANDYARQTGKQGFAALSNNFALAQMVKPVWAGCVASSTAEFKTWLVENQLPLFPWSSQARGFFVAERSQPDKLDDRELVDSWYSADNFARQARCFQLAEQQSVQPVSVALAYVLQQPFPVFPLIGPRQISETVTSFEALDIHLTEKELRWLNLEVDALY